MADNQKKDGFFKKIASYAKATKSEVKKVSWPTRKQLINNTGIVIVCIAVVGVAIFVLDTVFGFGFSFLNDQKLNSNVEDATEIATDFLVDYVEDYTDVVDTVEVATEVE